MLRLAAAAGLLLGISTLLFWGVELAPGDAATQALGPRATPEAVAALRAELGLDRPAVVRYLDWLGGLLRGDLGSSAVSGRPVAEILAGPLTRTAMLATGGLLVAMVVGVGGGLLAGIREGSGRDRAISTAALAVLSTPEFVLGAVLITIFALLLGWFPAVSLVPVGQSPLNRPEVLVLPAVTVGLVAGGYVARLVRSVVVVHARAPHIEAARLDGVPAGFVVWRHLLPGAAGPIAVIIAMVMPYLVGGTVVVEQVFGYPGLGRSLVAAIGGRDQLVVQGAAMVLATGTALAYVAADTIARLTDPHRWAR